MKCELFYMLNMNRIKAKFVNALRACGSTARAMSHSALPLPGIAVLPLKVISCRAVSYNVASRQVVINGSHQNYHGKQ